MQRILSRICPAPLVVEAGNVDGKLHDRLAPSLLFFDALKNECCAVSRQDALGIRLLAAF